MIICITDRLLRLTPVAQNNVEIAAPTPDAFGFIEPMVENIGNQI